MKKRFKKILSMLLAVAMVISCIQTPVYATEAEQEDFVNSGIVYAVVNGNAQVTDGKSASGDVVIPEKVTIDGVEYAVTSIAGNAFNDANEVTSIVVPNSVTSLGGAAFANMDKLKSITIGSGVTSWGSKLAVNNNELETVVVAEGATLIGDLAFRTCPKLANVTLPSTLKTIGATAFAYSAITELEVPASVETIGADAFKDIDTLKKVTFLGDDTKIGSTAFQMCDGLETVVLPENLSVIPQGAFRYCTSLKNISFPESLTEIGNYSFQGCTSLESVTISKNITNLVTNAFNGCTSLKNLTIEEGFAGTIGGYVFQGCTALESVVIPSSMETVGESMFNMCSNLKNVTLSEGVKTLNISAFANCTSLETLTLPDSLERMRHGSIANCTGLKTLIVTGENLPVIEHSNALDGLSEDIVVVYAGDDEFTGNWAALADNVVDELAISGEVTEDIVWNDGDIVKDITIKGGTEEEPIEITVNGTVTVKGTIRLNPDTISHVVFKGNDNAKLIRGGDFTGQMFYAEGVSGDFQTIEFNDITLDGGAVWTGDVDKTLNRGIVNEGVKATGSVLYLVYTNVVMNNSTLQNHDDSTGEKANAVFLRYYSTIDFNDSVVKDNNSISTYYRGGVVTVRQGGTVKTNNAEVYGNSGAAGGFFGISSTGSFGGVAEVKDSKFHNNYSDNGAVFLMQCNSKKGYLSIDRCEFYNNASKTAVLTEWAYSRPFIIKDSYFHDNECAVWDCHADPELYISGEFVVEEDADYDKYLFETPIGLSGSLSKESSIAMSEASITKLMANGYIATGTEGYIITDNDIAKIQIPDGYEVVLADGNNDGNLDAIAVKTDELGEDVILTLKDSKNTKATQKVVVYSGVKCLPACEFEHEGYIFVGWADKDGDIISAQKFTEAKTLTAQWAPETPVLKLSRDNATLKVTVENMNEDMTYTYQWYMDDVVIDGATEATYTMTDATSHLYECEVTVTDGTLTANASVSGNSSVPAVATIGEVKYATFKQAVEAANAVEDGTSNIVITLHDDIEIDAPINFYNKYYQTSVEEYEITLDGNGHTITWADGYAGTLFNVEAGVGLITKNLTIDGENAFEFYNDTTTVDNGQNWYTRFVNVGEEDKAVNADVFVSTGNLTLGEGTKIQNVTIASTGSNGKTENTDDGGYYLMYNDDLAIIKSNGGTVNMDSATITGNAGMVLNAVNTITNISDTTIDGNMGVGNKGGIIIANNGTMTIEGESSISNNKAMARSATILGVINGAEVEIKANTKIDNNKHLGVGSNTAGAIVVLEGASQFVMNGGSISNNVGGRAGAIASRWVGGSYGQHEDTSIVLNAGTITGNTASNDSWNNASVFLRSPAAIGKGMTIDGVIVVNAAPGELDITGGTFKGPEENAIIVTDGLSAEIVGGTFYYDPTEWCAEGYKPYNNDNGTWTVKVKEPVAQVGDAKYTDLKEAIEACTNGETVTLLADITYGEADVHDAVGGATGFGDYSNPSIIDIGGTKGATDDENQPSNVDAVIDLNGHTITNNADAYLFLIMDNANVTFTDSSEEKTGAVVSTTNTPVLWVTGTETLVTIKSGKYTTKNAEGLMWATHSGDLVINGGEFNTTAEDASLLIIRNSQDRQNSKYFISGKSTVTVKGGTFHGFNPEEMMDDSTTPFTKFDAVTEECKAINNNGVWGVENYVKWIKTQLLAGNDVTLEKDIMIDGSDIESIPHAVNGNGKYPNYGIFTVVGDYDVEFDLNGHTITYEGHKDFEWNGKTYNSCTVAHGVFFANGGADLTIIDSSVDKTGAVTVYGLASGAYCATPNTTLTIKGGTWKNEGCKTCGGTNIFIYPLQGGEIYIEDGHFEQALDSEGESYLLVVHGGEYANSVIDYSKTKLVISGGTFVGMNPEEAKYFCQTADNKLDMTKEPVNVVDEGFEAVKNSDGSWGIDTKYIAKNLTTEDLYVDVTDALDAAKTGETVQMLNDYEESFVKVPAGVTFDLNGKYLVATDLLSYGDVIDTAATVGGVVISNDTTEAFVQLQKNNKQLPIYDTTYTEDSAAGCYRFFEYELETKGSKLSNGNAKFGFALKFTNYDAYTVLANTSNSSISLVLDIIWTGMSSPVDYTFKDTTIQTYATNVVEKIKNGENPYERAITLTVKGLNNLTAGDKIEVKPYVEAVAGVVTEGNTAEYVVQ